MKSHSIFIDPFHYRSQSRVTLGKTPQSPLQIAELRPGMHVAGLPVDIACSRRTIMPVSLATLALANRIEIDVLDSQLDS
jgi:hypothetical protein